MALHTKLTPMRCLLITLMVVVCVCCCAYIVASTISVDFHSEFEHKLDNRSPFPGNSGDHIEWFVQISDIHISLFYDKKRAPDLRKFIDLYIKQVIKPKVVLVTGDITDAKLPDFMGSKQYLEEWSSYNQILKDTEVTETTEWLDVRGNHDAFNVPSLDDKENMFRKYSSKGSDNSRSYIHQHKCKDGDTISFIAIDACPDPGPRRPFNFFGVLTQSDLNELAKLKEYARNSSLTLWFGHYPTSIIWSPKPGIRKLLGDSIYMNGHLHSLLGFVPSMYAIQKEGILEIEVGDWKDNRMYRIFAVDHGLFSFTDEVLNQWPVILITNPKNAQFNMPKLEPVGRTKHSTHIRLLAFSPWEIKSVSVKIDGLQLENGQHVKGPLFVVPWQPTMFESGLHNLEVTVLDFQGNERTVSQSFSLDNTRMRIGMVSRYILMMDHYVVFQFMFLASLVISTIPLVILRFCNIQVEVKMNGHSCSKILLRFVQSWIRRCYLIAKTDWLFYPLIGFNLYVAFGPWFIGELIDGYIGVAFIHGLYVANGFIPGTLTYLYGYFQMMTFNIPLILYLGCVKDWNLSEHKHCERSIPLVKTTIPNWISKHGFFVALMAFQLYLAVTGFYRAYGLIVLLMCPLRTWSVPFAIYLRYIALKTNFSNLRNSEISNDVSNHAS